MTRDFQVFVKKPYEALSVFETTAMVKVAPLVSDDEEEALLIRDHIEICFNENRPLTELLREPSLSYLECLTDWVWWSQDAIEIVLLAGSAEATVLYVEASRRSKREAPSRVLGIEDLKSLLPKLQKLRK